LILFSKSISDFQKKIAIMIAVRRNHLVSSHAPGHRPVAFKIRSGKIRDRFCIANQVLKHLSEKTSARASPGSRQSWRGCQDQIREHMVTELMKKIKHPKAAPAPHAIARHVARTSTMY